MDSPLSGPRPTQRRILTQRIAFSLVAAVGLILFTWQLFPGFVVTVLGSGEPIVSRQLPEFPESSRDRWLNSEPLRIADLKGDVVLLDVWTFGCGNCVRSLPWVRSLLDRYGQGGFRVIGVHSPEFGWERDRSAVEENLRKHRIDYPNLMDNDFAYWKKLGNRYWPTFYLADRSGTIRFVHLGETHAGDPAAAEVEGMIETLLKGE